MPNTPIVIEETAVTGLPGRTPREQLEGPVTRFKREPAIILDASGSEAEYADPEGTITKTELICQVVTALVPVMEKDDAQAPGEASGGGCRAIAANEPGDLVFEDGEDTSDDPRDLHDINSANLKERLDQFRALVAQRGRTFLMPAVRALKHAYDTEFPGDKTRCLELVILTDGKLNDPKDFEQWLAGNAGPHCVICVAVIGYGDGHDQAVEHYQTLARSNKFITVDALTGVTDPLEVAYDVQFMAGLAE